MPDRSGEIEWGRLAALAAGCDVVVGEVLEDLVADRRNVRNWLLEYRADR